MPYVRLGDLPATRLPRPEDLEVCVGPDGCGSVVFDKALHERHHATLRRIEHTATQALNRSQRP